MENHLLGGLRGDAAQRFGRLRNADLGIELGIGFNGARGFERNFLVGIGDFAHHAAHAENLNRTGPFVEIGHQVFGGAEVLARGHQHGVFDGIENDLRVDAAIR